MIHDNLSKLRKKNGMTQEILASKLHVTRQTISKWEKGLSVPDAEMMMKIAEIFDEDVSVLLGAEIPDPEKENEIAKQLARISEQMSLNNRRKKRFWHIIFGILLTIAILAAWHGFSQRTTARYGYAGTQALFQDDIEITDTDTREWIQVCDERGMEYYILFSASSPAEISEGHVGKVFIYVPKGFSDIEFYFNDDSSLFHNGKRMDLQIGEPYTEKKTYYFALIETPQNNISTITLQDLHGTTLTPVITKTHGGFYVFGKYYEYYNPGGCDMDMQSASTVDSFLKRMPLERHFGNFQYTVSGNKIHLKLEKSQNEKRDEELRCWGLIFISRMKNCESFSWSYPGESGGATTREVTRANLDSLFPNGGYQKTWAEFQMLCPQ